MKEINLLFSRQFSMTFLSKFVVKKEKKNLQIWLKFSQTYSSIISSTYSDLFFLNKPLIKKFPGGTPPPYKGEYYHHINKNYVLSYYCYYK